MKEAECQPPPSAETEDEDEDESSTRSEVMLEHTHNQLSHAHAPEFSMEPGSSPGGEGSPLEGSTDRPEAGGCVSVGV